MNHKPCYANSFSCNNQRFTQESSLGMRELITGVPNTPTVMMRIVLLGWGSKWDQPHKVSMLAKSNGVAQPRWDENFNEAHPVGLLCSGYSEHCVFW